MNILNFLNAVPAAAYYAFFGGLAVNIVRLGELANVSPADRPATFSNPYFILQFLLMPVIGGGLALAYQESGSNLTPIVAINIGASAPLIIKSFAAAIPPIGSKKTN